MPHGLPGDLAEIDALLDDEAFFEPFRPFFDPTIGRPSVPIETYIRMMFLKYRYRLGFEPLCREVADSIAWRRFCRVPLGEVPHPTTLMKITTRCGEAAAAGLNERLLAKAAENKVIHLDKVRADTAVIEANVAYPTDSGLLVKGVALSAAIKAAGLAARTKTPGTAPDRSGRRTHDIAAWLRRRNVDANAKEEVKVINAEMADIATSAIAEGRPLAVNARRCLHRAGRERVGQGRGVGRRAGAHREPAREGGLLRNRLTPLRIMDEPGVSHRWLPRALLGAAIVTGLIAVAIMGL